VAKVKLVNWKIPSTLIALLLSYHSSGVGQNVGTQFSLADSPCGNPYESSDIYVTPDEYENARVTRVVNGNTVIVTLRNTKRKRVKLGGVDAPDIKTEAGQLSQRYLSGLVLNKPVTILLYGSNFKAKVVGGRISSDGVPSDINLAMLEFGMGRYGLVEHLGSYDKCIYRLAAEKAQKEKKGLWKK
jgi:endonuclease YncB( thermonuclease family)